MYTVLLVLKSSRREPITIHDQELCCSFDYVCNLVLISMNKFFKDNEIARAGKASAIFSL